MKRFLEAIGLNSYRRATVRGWVDAIDLRAVRRRRQMITFHMQFITPDALVFDVGANTGDRTAVYLSLGARVVAVEPQAECVKRLQRRFGSHHRFHLVPKALGEQDGTQQLFISTAHTISSMSSNWIEAVKNGARFSACAWNVSQQVPVGTLDGLIEEYGIPSFVKIDVEGFEPEVLKGLSRQIPMLSIEFTPEIMDSTVACIQSLAKLGEYRFNYSLAESMEFALDSWEDAEGMISKVSVFRNHQVWGDIYAKALKSPPSSQRPPAKPEA